MANTWTTPRTASTAVAKNVHAGSQTVTATYSASATLSTADVIQMVKVPSGAVVTDVTLLYTNTAGSNVQFSIGDGDSTARYNSASLSATGITRATAGVPYSYSQDDTIDIKITGQTSACSGGTFSITVTYKMDDPITVN